MAAATPPDGSQTSGHPFVVVGLGASAGGLDALEGFFSGLPTTDSCAFVVVIHLAPDRESEMAEILGRVIPIPVVQVSDKVKVETGHVYVIPPNRNLVMEDGHLRLEPIESERRLRRPIDYFFRTLAGAYGDHAVAVVLSGTGHNGTVGVRAVKEAGGLILAQAPDDAQFDEMPRSAIASGVVDTVDTAGGLARATIAYADRLRRVTLPTAEPEALRADDVQAVRSVLGQLQSLTGHDFEHYKRSTILRRLERRLHVAGVDTISDYAVRLRHDRDEGRELLQDLLISVTNFFRDADAFAAFEATVVPVLFADKTAGDTVRVWVAGCATGEEAYTVAMLLAEYAQTLADAPTVQVFGTDLSETAIGTAREGVYPESIEADVTEERLERWFRHDIRGYRVVPALRDLVLFAPHSLLKDPPFSHVDAVTCRNLLIYFQRTLQQRVLELFHYALNPGGVLFLGTSETAEAFADGYTALDKARRIYHRRESDVAVTPVPYLPRGPRARTADATARAIAGTPPAAAAEPPTSFADLHRRLRADAAPPSVLVSENRDVVHFSEDAGPFLQFAAGEPTRNLIRLVRPELRVLAQTALFQADRERRTVTTGAVRLDVHGAPHDVRLRVSVAGESGLSHVFFDAEPARPTESDGAAGDGAAGDGAAELAAEVQNLREQLQLSVEEFETSREELQAQNEELQSINEELRSTAEELETSKEETQSMAEELMAVNDEMKVSVEELSRSTSDLQNLIASTGIATLFLDRQLRITWFTPPVRALFHVLATDIGRPLSDFAQRFGGADLLGDARRVLGELQTTEREVQSENGRWFLVHVRAYQSTTDHIDGVVLTFVDITERYRQEEALRESEERYRGIIGQGIAGIVFVDLDGRFLSANPRFCEIVGCPDEAALVGTPMEAITHPDDLPAEIPLFERLVADGVPFQIEKRYVRPDGTSVWVENTVAPVRDAAGRPRSVVALSVDVSERKRAEAALGASETRYRTLFTSMSEGFALCEAVFDAAGVAVDYRVLDVNPAYEAVVGLTREQVVGRLATEIVPDIEPAFIETYGRVAAEHEPARFESRMEGLGRWLDTYAFPVEPAGSGRFGVVVSDVTARKTAEAALRASAERAAFRVALTDALRPLAAPADVQSEAARVLGEYLGASRAHYAAFEPGGAHFVIDQDHADGVASFAGRHLAESYGVALIAALRAGETVVATDEAGADGTTDAERAALAAAEIGAFVAVPLVKDGHLAAVLAVHTRHPRAWTPDEVTLVEETAERTWAAAERARAEAALRESEQQRRLAMDAAHMGTYVWTAGTDAVEADARVCEIFGFAPDDSPMARADFHAYLHPEDRALLSAAREEAVGEAEAGDEGRLALAFRVVRPGGELHHVEVNSRTFSDAGGAVVSVGLVLDVTERVRAEDDLRASEARYRTLFESIDEGFVDCEMIRDDDGRFVDFRWLAVNPAWEAMTGMTVAQALGRTVREAIPDVEDFWIDVYARMVEADEPTRFENYIAPLDRWLDVYAFPRGGDRFAAIFTDVTERRAAEAEIRTLNATLERRVAEQTQQVRTLAARLAVAEQAERQRIAHVLHDDLQQQLYGLSMILAMMARTEAVAAQSARATEILDGAVQMARTLATELSPAVLQAQRLADILEWVAGEEARRHGLTTAVEVRSEIALPDPALRILLYQMLREVLFNVVKHSGGLTARLTAHEADGEVVVTVEDDGAGFDAAAPGAAPGGFGLFSVRERLGLVGGRLEIDAAPGRGTRVTLVLPSARAVPE